jgi:hypothetical protein
MVRPSEKDPGRKDPDAMHISSTSRQKPEITQLASCQASPGVGLLDPCLRYTTDSPPLRFARDAAHKFTPWSGTTPGKIFLEFQGNMDKGLLY